jgi:Transcription factor WhiB
MAPSHSMQLVGVDDMKSTRPAHLAPMPGRFTEPASWALVIRHAQCSAGGLDPEEWFPVSADPGRARHEAAAAIAICTACPVRVHCLTLSLQHWDIGQHGVWGGLVAADRARLRRRVPAGQAAGPGPSVVRDDGTAAMSRPEDG